MRSSETLRAKARWYRAMAAREIGEDQEKFLAVARGFDARAQDREAHAATSAELLKLRRGRHRR
ncbi:MAG: hypothetical protein HY060_11100 [Proteobacteria bacterium]|nr:hypothetical protein [Pseudomonadota bacterium]